MSATLFYILATIVVLAALFMVTRRQPLTAAVSLVVCFIALAGLYAMLSAPLLAILQILVYAGAILALVVFVIMLMWTTCRPSRTCPSTSAPAWWRWCRCS